MLRFTMNFGRPRVDRQTESDSKSLPYINVERCLIGFRIQKVRENQIVFAFFSFDKRISVPLYCLQVLTINMDQQYHRSSVRRRVVDGNQIIVKFTFSGITKRLLN